MSENKQTIPSSETSLPRPLVEEKGLQPAKNPPPMPKVKDPKSEKSN